jgi:hypothetical protein
MVPSALTLSAPISPGCKEAINASVDCFLKVLSFGWLNKLSECNGFSGA